MRVLDSHLHLWDPAVLDYGWLKGPLARAFADLELDGARIDGADEERAVFVQADCAADQYLDEVRWVTALAPKTGVVAIVAAARLDRGGATSAQLESLAEHELVVGVRHLLQGEPDGLAVSPAFLAGARELAAQGGSFDACVRGARQLADVVGLATAVPELRIVLDHLGKPAAGTGAHPLPPAEEWMSALSALGRLPRVHCKLSGLPAQARGDWTAAQVEPFLDAAADAFGPDRLMWGSDWPVSAIGPAEARDPHLASDGSPSYQPSCRTRWATAVAQWADSRGLDADAILWRNAELFYRRA